MTDKQNEMDLVEDKVIAAMERSLSWLSSYPGGGALGCYDQMREALAIAMRDAKLRPLYEEAVSMLRNARLGSIEVDELLRSIEEAKRE